MVQYQATNNGLGIDEMMNVLMNRTWLAPRLNGLEGLILQQNEQLLLTYLLGVSLNDKISFATQAAVLKAIENIRKLATNQLVSSNAATVGYSLLTLERIKNRLTAKLFVPEAMPPGSPIGCDMN